jgi:hypothetical protein
VARFKKPKPLSRSRSACVPVVAGFPGVIAGFPEFWQKAHDRCPAFFKAANELVPLVNRVLTKPVKGQLQVVLHFFSGIVANSFGSLITLTLNGYGHDAMRISRGMFEAAVNAAYLKLHREEIGDFLNYHWIRQKKLYDYMQKSYPDGLKRISPEAIADMHVEYPKVVSQYLDKNGKVRGSWCKNSIQKRAKEVGLGELYSTFYFFASSIHHGDIGGLSAQALEGRLQVDIAPSFAMMKDALMMGHNAVLIVIDALNKEAQFSLDKEISEACSAYMSAWKD